MPRFLRLCLLINLFIGSFHDGDGGLGYANRL